MKLLFVLIIFECSIIHLHGEPSRVKFKEFDNRDYSVKVPYRVLIAIDIRNHAHSLPTFLATLETVECQQKCNLWIIFEQSTDKSHDIFMYWLSHTRERFDTISIVNTNNENVTRGKHPELDHLYFSKNLKLRALKYALDRNFSHVFFLRADNIITNCKTIEILISKNKTIVAPMLTSNRESMHSNFWAKVTGQEKESDNLYSSIYNRELQGCLKVVGVFSCFLVDLGDRDIYRLLEQVQKLHRKDDEPVNDDIAITHSIRKLNMLAHICNRDEFGYIPEVSTDSESEAESFYHLRIQHLVNGPNKSYNKPLLTTHYMEPPKVKKTKLGFDQIYVINLERRNDRRERIESALNDLNLSYKLFKAIDSQSFDENYLKQTLGIKTIPNYRDPYNNRSLNYGEIGCFLSHYFIWKEVIDKGYKQVLILEDDANFVLGFKSLLAFFLNQMTDKNIIWDLLYLGRKQMSDYVQYESWIDGIGFSRKGYGIIKPSYSHWTVAYALTFNGAKKLVESEPLKKIVPVDEYLPIMFNSQPNEYWNSFYQKRDLLALAVQPNIVKPTHYTGEPNYITDTEHTQSFTNPIQNQNNDLKHKSSDNTIQSQRNAEFSSLHSHLDL